MKTRLLTAKDLEAIVSSRGVNRFMDELICELRDGFSRLDAATVNIPVRTGIQYRNPGIGLLEWMPAMTGENKASLKIVGYHPSNPSQYKLPTILSTICIFDTHTGHLTGIFDGTLATAARTGAMSALATDLLCPEACEGIVGLIGCGAQSVTQLHALSRIRTITKVLVFDTDPSAVDSFRDRVSFLPCSLEIKSIEKSQLGELVQNADILCTCTSETPGCGPVFSDGPHKPNLHINAVGSDFPGKTEVPLSVLKRSLLVPDFRQQALAEGECQQLPPEAIACDLHELLASPSRQREGKSRLSVFDSTGHAYADYLAGAYLLASAERLEIGSFVEIECVPPDPRNPYSFLSQTYSASGYSRALGIVATSIT